MRTHRTPTHAQVLADAANIGYSHQVRDYLFLFLSINLSLSLSSSH